MGYVISKFLPEVQDYIKANSIDVDANEKIDKEELQQLLSGMNSSKVDELLVENPKLKDYKRAAVCGGLAVASSSALLLQDKFMKYPLRKWMQQFVESDKYTSAEAKALIRKNLPGKWDGVIVAGVAALIFLGVAANFVFRKPENS